MIEQIMNLIPIALSILAGIILAIPVMKYIAKQTENKLDDKVVEVIEKYAPQIKDILNKK